MNIKQHRRHAQFPLRGLGPILYRHWNSHTIKTDEFMNFNTMQMDLEEWANAQNAKPKDPKEPKWLKIVKKILKGITTTLTKIFTDDVQVQETRKNSNKPQ